MRNTILISCLFLILISCNNNDSPKTKTNLPIPPAQDVPLNVTLNMTHPSYSSNQPITLRFVLTNNTPETVTFCQLNSPANGQNYNNCFRINDAKGNSIPFIGTIYNNTNEDKNVISIEGNGIRLYTVDLRPMYALNEKGTYTIRFIGDQVNLLSNSSPARFIIK